MYDNLQQLVAYCGWIPDTFEPLYFLDFKSRRKLYYPCLVIDDDVSNVFMYLLRYLEETTAGKSGSF